MSSLFTPGQGFFVRQPSWHGLEKAVLAVRDRYLAAIEELHAWLLERRNDE